ncbi:hypothetical protein ACJJTC_009510 [Scirpophaga incertulas]
MEDCQKSTENSNSQVEVTIRKPVKILHFSDGVDEEIEEESLNDLHHESSSVNSSVDPSTLGWAPWISHYAWKSSTKMLFAVDYAGESLANFLVLLHQNIRLK